MAAYTKDNRSEVPNKKPVAMPLGYERPETLQEMIARMVRVHSDMAKDQGLETLEEADDFDVNDDNEIVSPYQLSDMQEDRPYVEPKPQPKPPIAEPKKAEAEQKTEPNKSASANVQPVAE